MNQLPLDTLNRCLAYDPATGLLSWRERPASDFKTKRACSIWNVRFAGTVAGSKIGNGYLQVRIGGRSYYAHRLAWAISTGAWPDDDIDHINGVPDDNRLDNLRAATRSQNLWNRSVSPKNKSGLKGVSLHKPSGLWIAQIKANRVARHLGYFRTPEEAHKAYGVASAMLHGEFGRQQ